MLTNFPNGLSSFGVPVLGPLLTTGKVLFVDSNYGRNDPSMGGDPDRPLASLDYAVGLCRAGYGDVILLKPGHSETITAAGGTTLDVADVSVIGLGTGSSQAKFTFSTSTAATFLVSAANNRLVNLMFDYTGIDAVATGLHVTGANTTVDSCVFVLGNSSAQCSNAVTTDADNIAILNSEFRSPNAGPVSAISGITAKSNLRVVGCRFFGNFSTAAIYNATAAWTNFLVDACKFFVASATGIGVSVHASATGIIADSKTFVTANVAAGGTVTAAAAAIFNHLGMESAHVGASAQVDPTAGGFA